MATKKSKVMYGVSEGEEMGRGPQKAWEHGTYRKQAEKAFAKRRIDDNETDEANIREYQTRLKSDAEYQKDQTSKRLVSKKRQKSPSSKTVKSGRKPARKR